MSQTYISAALRRLVIERADGRCEYCLISHTKKLVMHQVDHIIAEQHGGETTLDNLALSCFQCNKLKGPNIASIDWENGEMAPLFNPRIHEWTEHFMLLNAQIEPLTPIGRSTDNLLHFNDRERLIVRKALLLAGRYP